MRTNSDVDQNFRSSTSSMKLNLLWKQRQNIGYIQVSSKLPKTDMNTKIPHNKYSLVFHMKNELEEVMEMIKHMKNERPLVVMELRRDI